jgi:hypothetical protein
MPSRAGVQVASGDLAGVVVPPVLYPLRQVVQQRASDANDILLRAFSQMPND